MNIRVYINNIRSMYVSSFFFPVLIISLLAILILFRVFNLLHQNQNLVILCLSSKKKI